MNRTRPYPLRASLTVVLALTLLAPPASAEGIGLNRNVIPDASLRHIRHVVCVSYSAGAEPSFPVYERNGDGAFHAAGILQREKTSPLSRSVGFGWTDDCYPATRAVQAGGPARYAEAVIDVYTGKKAWLRASGEDRSVTVTIDSLETLEAFTDRHVDFSVLRRRDQPLVVRKGPADSAAALDVDLPADAVVRQRQGDFIEVHECDEAQERCTPLGWVRLVDPSGLLLVWPSPSEDHEC